jgi:hypothetical protein
MLIKLRPMQLSEQERQELVRLRGEVAKLKSERRGSRAKGSHLHSRVWTMMEMLGELVEPGLKTIKKRRYDDAVEPVKRLLGWE